MIKFNLRLSITLMLYFLLMNGASGQNSGLLINELSQGTSGSLSGEYVELLVYNGGVPIQSCEVCLDIRGWIIDDNNGYYPSNTSGISTGAIRFANIPQWECVPFGSLILIYDESFDFAADGRPLPPDDETDSNGDCIYVLPGSSSLFDGEFSVPKSTDPLYDSANWADSPAWNAGFSSFNTLNNSIDAFFTIPPNNPDGTPNTTYAPYSALTWGPDNAAIFDANPFTVYLGNIGDYSGTVTNLGSNPSQYSIGFVPNDETPGLPNNIQNQDIINTWNTCGVAQHPTVLSVNN